MKYLLLFLLLPIAAFAQKISEYDALTAPAAGDLFEVVDVSDTSLAATGTNKKITWANLFNSPTFTTSGTFPNTGLKLLDTNASHTLTIAPGTNLTANRTFTLTTGDEDRNLEISVNGIVLDQNLETISSPTFASLNVPTVALGATGVLITNDNDGAITFLGASGGSDEDFTLNLDDTADTVVVTSSTGVTSFAFGGIGLSTDTLTLSGTGTINGVDAIDGTTETTLEAALELQSLQGAVTDGQVPNNITIDLATLASTATVIDGTDSTSFVLIADSATGSLPIKTDGALTYNASNGTLGATTFTGAGGGLTLDASGFDGNLATTDNTLQEIAQKLDDLSLGATDFDALDAATETDLDADDVIAVSHDGTEKKITLANFNDWIEAQALTFGAVALDLSAATVTLGPISGDLVANGPGITLDASGFDGNLATTDNTFQEIAQKLDDLSTGGTTAINDLGDASGDGSVAQGAHEMDITSTIDASGEAVLTITNTDADAANDNSLIDLRHNDGADANVFYLRMIGDNDGTPTNDFLFSQAGFTSTLPVNVPAEAYDATGWNSDTGAPQKDAVRDQMELKAPLVSPSFTTPALGTIASGVGTALTGLQHLTVGADPDISTEGDVAYESDIDQLRGYDGTQQFSLARKTHPIQVTVVLPNDLADSERDAFWIWENVSGMSFIVTGWSAKSDTDDTTLNIEEIDGDGQNNATVDAVEIATNGTGIFTGADTTITAATIENGHLLVLDFDDTDTPGQVKITIYGYFSPP